MQEEIIRVHVKIEDVVMVNGNTQNVNMIQFSGYAKGQYFQGEILPCGVDLQRSKAEGRTTLSARYILEGMDCNGSKCRIFIENNGTTDEKGKITTKPVIVTDSKALSWMETADLTGDITSENNMVIIHIYNNK